jgi:hypothetical protein
MCDCRKLKELEKKISLLAEAVGETFLEEECPNFHCRGGIDYNYGERPECQECEGVGKVISLFLDMEEEKEE